uniref:(northern house mosquito) hypothetical protein n=1 Tax=Culex pipiens TaxID=7175 RepID=A0A8D8KWW6_CULPI
MGVVALADGLRVDRPNCTPHQRVFQMVELHCWRIGRLVDHFLEQDLELRPTLVAAVERGDWHSQGLVNNDRGLRSLWGCSCVQGCVCPCGIEPEQLLFEHEGHFVMEVVKFFVMLVSLLTTLHVDHGQDGFVVGHVLLLSGFQLFHVDMNLRLA